MLGKFDSSGDPHQTQTQPRVIDVWHWAEFKALAERLGIPWGLSTSFLQITMLEPDAPVRITHTYEAGHQQQPCSTTDKDLLAVVRGYLEQNEEFQINFPEASNLMSSLIAEVERLRQMSWAEKVQEPMVDAAPSKEESLMETLNKVRPIKVDDGDTGLFGCPFCGWRVMGAVLEDGKMPYHFGRRGYQGNEGEACPGVGQTPVNV